MKHEEQIEAAASIPHWLVPSEARELLGQEIEAFVKAVAEATAMPDAALALKVTAGLGKTATALRVIARYGEALLAQGHVLIYMPTLDLAERAHAEFRELAPEVASRVIRGRDALRPKDRDKRMCEQADIAKKISGVVPSVTQALCRGQDPNGNIVLSACASHCPYLEQKDIRGPHVVFLAHSYLTIQAPIDGNHPVVLRVVDEKVWPALKRTSQISVEDFMRAPPPTYLPTLRRTLARARAAIIEGLQSKTPVRDHLQSMNVSSENLTWLARAEEEARGRLDIGPWQSRQQISQRIENFDRNAFIASRHRQQIFSSLVDNDAERNNAHRLVENSTDQGSQQIIQIAGLSDIPRDSPLLLLDADADRTITERVAPGAAFVSIQSPPVADIVQISDVTMSDSWLLDPQYGTRRRASVLKILEREVDRSEGGGVLVVAKKAVLRALHADTGRSLADGDDMGLRQPIHGAEARWFGPRTQGINDFESFATIVVIGRLQPRISEVERAACAVFAQDTDLIATHASGPLPAAHAQALMADGSVVQAMVRAHSDPRVQAILAQTRECATLQSIARLRLVSPNRKKRVVILSNLPLPEFPITRRVTFARLERDLEHEPDWQGFMRLESALRKIAARPLRGTQLSAAGLAADLPHGFGSELSAKRFRRGRPTQDVVSLCQRVAAANGWMVTPIRLRRSQGGKAVPAIILDDQGAPLEMARTLWPDFTPKIA